MCLGYPRGCIATIDEIMQRLFILNKYPLYRFIGSLRSLARPDKQRQLSLMRRIVPQHRTLQDRRPTPNPTRIHRQLKLERANEGKQDRLEPVRRQPLRYPPKRIGDALHESEAVADAASRSSDKGQQVTPNTWHVGHALGDVGPPFWSAAHLRSTHSARGKNDALEFVSIGSP